MITVISLEAQNKFGQLLKRYNGNRWLSLVTDGRLPTWCRHKTCRDIRICRLHGASTVKRLPNSRARVENMATNPHSSYNSQNGCLY
ncbi:hypothetical protein AFERRID_28210 [Acidithiobacillus ferridurans]|uniref:Uncharacterized protein n=1 Tax=Acidithiobacillus ferridurans TaxID=1232575 RepID=A0A2Z6IP27_ACIFI|nr:hypothetical protein AFERRID_28210 [Acidithiobacillus ferridurans]